MALADEIKKEKEKLKGASFRTKTRYFLDYYLERTLVVVAIMVVIALSLYFQMTAPETICTGVFLNCPLENAQKVDALAEKYVTIRQLDSLDAVVAINTSLVYRLDDEQYISESYNTGQTLSAQIEAESLDFIVGDWKPMQVLAYAGLFTDLSTVLSEEQMERYEPYFLYIDRSRLDSYQNIEWDKTGEAEDLFAEADDPTMMEDPIPIVIKIGHYGSILDIYTEETLVFAIAANTSNLEKALDFLSFLNEE